MQKLHGGVDELALPPTCFQSDDDLAVHAA
jgi:hypothetical protein